MTLERFNLYLPIVSSFYFDPFVSAKVEAEIKMLPNNKAYGLYSCPAVRILKLSHHIISQPLAQIFNVSVYPQALSQLNLKSLKSFSDSYKIRR